LESRRLTDGTEILKPDVAGVLEWFPLSETGAYATIVLSQGADDVNFTGALYNLDGGSFSRDEYARLGAGYLSTSWSQDVAPTRNQGTYLPSEKSAKLTHADGTLFEFVADDLTVTRKDGGVDRWKRDADLKGLLAK